MENDKRDYVVVQVERSTKEKIDLLSKTSRVPQRYLVDAMLKFAFNEKNLTKILTDITLREVRSVL